MKDLFLKPHLIIIRGIPGSGKSSFANLMTKFNYYHIEADMYYYMKYGEYKWSKEEAPLAHEWCQKEFKKLIEKEKNIVISNTFIKKSEMEPYIKLANEHNYNISIIKMMTNFNTIHNVPEDTIKRMRENFEE